MYFLRAFTHDDIPAIFRLLSDKRMNRFLPWFPLQSAEEAEVFFTERIENKKHYYAITSDGMPIGYVNISDDDSHDMGYAVLPEYWNRGIVTELAGKAIEKAASDGIPYITATHDVNNPASGRVMQKLGFSYKYTYQEYWMPKRINVLFRMYQMNLSAPKDFVYMKYWDESERHFTENHI